MSSTHEPLPDEWVDKIFQRLAVRYGRAFLDRWRDVPMEAVKADWALHLAGLQNRPGAITYALDNLPPDYPPTVGQFKAACNRSDAAPINALPAPAAAPVSAADRPVKRAALRRLAELANELRAGHHRRDPKAWAWKLKARHDAGEVLSRYQIHCYQTALKRELARTGDPEPAAKGVSGVLRADQGSGDTWVASAPQNAAVSDLDPFGDFDDDDTF